METNMYKIKSNLNINGLYEPCVFAHKIKSCTYQKKPG